jgi:2-succinyl-5-enolpyruvyl-6-hydroxy-3-cyclohexene-1-carboxylate synthase
VTALAARLDCPVLAEPLSNLRFGSHDRSRLCVHYVTWLKDPGFAEKYRPEWILHFGAWPVGRPLQNYLASASRARVLVEPWPRWTDPSHKISHLLRADPLSACHALLARAPSPAPDGWMASFADKEATSTPEHSATHLATLLAELPETTPLFIGNSLAIRQLDNHSGTGNQAFRFFANRGASGIDGNISTSIGIAAVHGSVAALLGDLTCQHDLGGLALAQGRNVVIAAVNNAGGGIFDLLPQAELPEFEQGWRTPQQISFEHAALTFGLGYAKAEDMKSFALALRHAFSSGGPWLVELLEQ